MVGRLFRDKSIEQQTTSLASFMPGGRPFLAARLPDTKLRSMLMGLAVELYRVDNLLNDITYEHEIGQTTLLIEEWERALGIPDHCFDTSGTIEQRRTNVLVKLAAMGVQSEQDFVDLATLLGFTVEIIAGAERGLFPFISGFPLYLFDHRATARFTMFVRITTENFPNVFTYTFPIVFGDTAQSVIECLFNQLKPANVEVRFEYTLPDIFGIIIETESGYILSEAGDSLLLENAP